MYYSKMEYYLKDRIVKNHCLKVFKRYFYLMSKNKKEIKDTDKIMKRIINKTLTFFWQEKYNTEEGRKKYICKYCNNLID